MGEARSEPTGWPTAATTVVGIIGDPIAHSLSPTLHHAAFAAMGLDWVSVGFPTPAGAAADALVGMRALRIAGLSVTMPHKADVAVAVDELTPIAARLGAVNCVTNRDGRLVGDSTDGPGLVAALRHDPGVDPAGRRCLVIGAGGAARAVVAALAEAGAAEVAVLNRSPERAGAAATLAGAVGRVAEAADVAEAELIVHATPQGMAGGPVGLPVDDGALHAGQVVVDLVYHPVHTALLQAAAARGATAVDGVGMLAHQAALAIERWTGQAAPVEVMLDAARAALGH